MIVYTTTKALILLVVRLCLKVMGEPIEINSSMLLQLFKGRSFIPLERGVRRWAYLQKRPAKSQILKIPAHCHILLHTSGEILSVSLTRIVNGNHDRK
jgi:hypothetical protein